MPKLDHVALRVADLDASIAFYTKKLGIDLLFKKVDAEHCEAFAFLELDGGNLELLQLLEPDGTPSRFEKPVLSAPYCPHIAFATDDLDAKLAEMKSMDVPILAGPLEIANSVRWLYFSDPDHNVLEYIEWIGRASPR